MDAVSDPTLPTIVIKSSAQVGKTEVVLNIIGYYMHQDPASMLVVLPTIELGQSFAKDRLSAMCRTTKVLADKLKDRKDSGSAATRTGSTLLHKAFSGGSVNITGSNSSVGLSSRPCRIILCDEVDRFPVSSNEEGDPVNLARKRSQTYWNRKCILTSTPTVLGASRIDAEWEESDKRYYFVPCPHCDEMQNLKWSQVIWPKDLPAEAQYCCEHCGVLWSEAERWVALKDGEWRPTAAHTGIAGFHLSELYSPWSTISNIAVEFVKAKRGGPETLQTWVNTCLGECWDADEGEKVDPDSLMARREEYPAQVPQGALVLTAGLDVQNDRVEWEVIGWGPGEESWGIEYNRLYGDLSSEEFWDDLTAMLRTTYTREDGVVMDVKIVGADSGGHYTDEVYKWSRRAGPRWIIPLKGYADPGKPIANFPRKRGKDHKVYLTMVGTDTAKEVIYGRYSIQDDGPGKCHWPIDSSYDRVWFEQATAERRQRKFKKGVAYFVWDAGGRRNEALDCRVYGLVGVRILQQHMGLRLVERVIKEQPDIPLEEEIADTQGEPRPPGKRKRVKGRRRSGQWVNYEGSWR